MSLADSRPLGSSSSLTRATEVSKAYFELTKPRINLLLLFTAYCAMIVAEGRLPSLMQTVVGLGGLALSAAGAAAVNMWFDRDIDKIMKRTASRPLPMGTVQPERALMFGIVLGLASIAVYLLFANPLAASLSAAGYLYYAIIYTMCLKRRTPQNIVIGGGAGAFPPLVGWASVTGTLHIAPVLMFAVIFLWTPAHFWALALYKSDDYKRAGVPMMPVVRGARTTKIQMLFYTILLAASSVFMMNYVRASWLYLAMAGLLSLWFLYHNIQLLVSSDNDFHWAKKTFHASLLYLPVIFTAMVVCALL